MCRLRAAPSGASVKRCSCFLRTEKTEGAKVLRASRARALSARRRHRARAAVRDVRALHTACPCPPLSSANMATALLHGGAATRPGAALAARPSRRTGVRSGVPPPAAAARPRLALRPPPCTAGACFPARRGGPPSTRCAASAVSVAAPPPVPAPAGVKLVPAALSVAVGLVIRFLVPCPAGVTMQARRSARPTSPLTRRTRPGRCSPSSRPPSPAWCWSRCPWARGRSSA